MALTTAYSSTYINMRLAQNLNTCSAMSPASVQATPRTTYLILRVSKLLQYTAELALLHTVLLSCDRGYLPRGTYTVATCVGTPRLTTRDAYIPQMNTLTFSARFAGPTCC